MADKIKRPHCSQPKIKPRKFAPSVDAHRASFILANQKKWVNGTLIKYFFLEGPESQRKVVRSAFQTWQKLGIGLSFVEVKNIDEAMVRIAFKDDGSWSYVGRDILGIKKPKSTMNFGWSLTEDAYGMTTALHEIGHTIGFEHEHQSPFSGIEWDVPVVYSYFAAPPNKWSKAETDSNVLDKLPANTLNGSTWDPKSIMEYQFDPGLVLKPVQYRNSGIYPPGTLSKHDVKGVKSLYPAIKSTKMTALKADKIAEIKAKSGGQSDFIFTAPNTGKFVFETKGELDTVMVIFEKDKNENHYMAGDDDSGLEKNAKITLPLVKGRKYIVNIRVMYAPENTGGALEVKAG
ncbi:MAG: M12 family metallopeptidase [Chitinophagales bacterium]